MLPIEKIRLFFILCVVVTIPFALFLFLGYLDDERGLILIIPFLAGLPWQLVFLILPFTIPGINSAPSDGFHFTLLHLLIFMVPVYINIFIVFLISNRVKNKHNG